VNLEVLDDAIIGGLPAEQIRAKIFALQDSLVVAIKDGEIVPYDFDANLQHHFAPGAYGRTLFFPKGTVIVGKIHKHAHLNILSQGEVVVLTESGGMERLKGPLTMVSPPGTKRAVYALEDTTWTTVHLTDETDLAKIEDHVIAPTYEDYEMFQQKALEVTP
jgi:quercetin dioxygenase-like cupin family protein